MSLFVIGNPLLDISVHTDTEFIKKHGKEPGLASLGDQSDDPLFDEIQAFDTVEYVAGGAGQNTARGVAYLASDLNVTYVGCVGDDKNGKLLAEKAHKDGVTTLYNISTKSSTGRCAVLVDNAERTLVAQISAANDYSHDHFLTQEVQDALNKATVVYAAGFFLTVSPETLVAIGKHCAENNKPFFVNIAAPFLVDFFWDKMLEVFKYADYIFGNETEAAAITKKLGGEEGDLKAGLKLVADLEKVNDKRTRTVVFTQGKDPVLVSENGVLSDYPVEALPQEKVLDTNAAGDSFCAGYLAGYMKGKNTEGCVDAGHYLASEVIQLSGATFPAEMTYKF